MAVRKNCLLIAHDLLGNWHHASLLAQECLHGAVGGGDAVGVGLALEAHLLAVAHLDDAVGGSLDDSRFDERAADSTLIALRPAARTHGGSGLDGHAARLIGHAHGVATLGVVRLGVTVLLERTHLFAKLDAVAVGLKLGGVQRELLDLLEGGDLDLALALAAGDVNPAVADLLAFLLAQVGERVLNHLPSALVEVSPLRWVKVDGHIAVHSGGHDVECVLVGHAGDKCCVGVGAGHGCGLWLGGN